MKITAKITNGKLPKDASNLIKSKLLEFEGVVVSIEIKQSKRPSLAQFGYLYGVVYPTLQHLFREVKGITLNIQEVDYFFKLRFYHDTYINPLNGEVEKYVSQKRKMNKMQLAEYTNAIIQFAFDEFGATMPEISDEQSEFVVNEF